MKKEIIVYSISDSLGEPPRNYYQLLARSILILFLIIVIASLSSIKKRSCWIFYVMP